MKVHMGAGALDQLIIPPSFPNISRTSRETVARLVADALCCMHVVLMHLSGRSDLFGQLQTESWAKSASPPNQRARTRLL
jgi:alkylhydroperoxidase family enzyme